MIENILHNIIYKTAENLVKNRCKGIVLGLSGTDSILTSIILSKVSEITHIPIHVLHFNKSNLKDIAPDLLEKKVQMLPSYLWEQRFIIPWLQKNYSNLNVQVINSHQQMSDAERYAYIMDYALSNSHRQDDEQDKTLWLSGTRNKTEDILGLYSNISNIVSIQPIISLYKSQVLELCSYFNVPEIAIAQSRIVDCDCGRYDLIANNIEALDSILIDKEKARDNIPFDIYIQLIKFINTSESDNAFKKLIPYRIGEE